MHKEQQEFFQAVKAKNPTFFRDCRVLDVGSLDINGNNRYLFENCDYVGIDVGPGPNVDIVCPVHEFKGGPFDTIISGECFEHDQHFTESIKSIIMLLKKDGLFVMTCATTGRQEHGTRRTSPTDSPHTTDFYRNLTDDDFNAIPEFGRMLGRFITSGTDLYYFGIKL